MRLIKCPRCELNYITEDEGYCKVCKREMRGERQRDEIEMCTVCNEAPALPGKDEIIPEIDEDIPPREYDEIESDLSLEEMEEEEAEDDEDEDEEE